MSNTITISITLTADTDSEKLGEAIAHLIQAITPRKEWGETALSMRFQVSEQLERLAANPPDEPSETEDFPDFRPPD